VLLLDTDILVDILRGYEPAVEWFAQVGELPAVPGFVVMELIQDADNQARVDKAMKLVDPLPVVWPSPQDCARALADFRTLHLAAGLGLLDALIGACAIGHAATLCTFNVKHYGAVDGLETAQPYPRLGWQ
jgi:predicted nucleic acid-binding protein